MAFNVTRCPGCESTFNTNPAVLTAAAGKVRCGACLTVFEAEPNFVLDDSGVTGDEPESVFVSSEPDDYFDPSRFLTRRSLQEGLTAPAVQAETSNTAPEAEPVEPDAPPVEWGMGPEQETGPQFAYPEQEPDEQTDPGVGETGDFFSAVEKGMDNEEIAAPESQPDESGIPPWVEQSAMDFPLSEAEGDEVEGESTPWQSEESVPDSSWVSQKHQSDSEEPPLHQTDVPETDFAAELEPNYETSSAEPIRSAQEEFYSLSQSVPELDDESAARLGAPDSVTDQQSPHMEVFTVAEDEAADEVEAMPSQDIPDATGNESAEEISDDEVRARAMQTRFEDEDALEAIPEENLSSLGSVANTLELPLGMQRDWGRNLILGLLVLLLSALLAGQYLWRYLPLYSLDTRLRPLYLAACEQLGCVLPVFQDISMIRSDGLVVRSHPERDNALIANITFQNTAPFPQPFPVMILSFNSATNSVIALRELSPDEYLPLQLQSFDLMPSGQPIQLSLELIDPGADAVNYTLAFRRP